MRSHALGSRQWADAIFAAPSIGHETKLKESHLFRSSARFGNERRRQTGGLPLQAAYYLDYFATRGVLSRWKPYPFSWPAASAHFARSATHFLAEFADDRHLAVIRIKATRYQTDQVRAATDWERDEVAQARMTYLLWSERSPLTPSCRDLHLLLRTANRAACEPAVLENLVEHVRRVGPSDTLSLISAGYPAHLFAVGVNRGLLHIDPTEQIHERTVFCADPVLDLRELLLGKRIDPLHWWNELPSR